MKHVYFSSFVFALMLLSGCSKDVLRKYDKRVVGTWRIADVNRFGLGSSNDVAFTNGFFTFNDDGTLRYTDGAGAVYQGSWDITKKWQQSDELQRALHITVVNFGTQDVISAYYDDMQFLGTNHFKATQLAGFKTYVTHFRR